MGSPRELTDCWTPQHTREQQSGLIQGPWLRDTGGSARRGGIWEGWWTVRGGF